MQFLNQTHYDTDWLDGILTFAFKGYHPSSIRVRYLPHPSWPEDGKHISGNTKGTYLSQCPGMAKVTIYLPRRMSTRKHCTWALGGVFIGRCTDEEGLVFIAAHEAAHTGQAARPRTRLERRLKNCERHADHVGIKRLNEWRRGSH